MIGHPFLCDVTSGHGVILCRLHFTRFSFVCGGTDCMANTLTYHFYHECKKSLVKIERLKVEIMYYNVVEVIKDLYNTCSC